MASSVPLTSKLFLLPPFPPFSTSAVASAAHSSPPSVSSARVLHVQNGNPHHTGIAHLCSSRTGRVQSCNCDGDGDGHCNGDNDDDGHMLDTSDSCAAPASSNSLQLHRGYTAPCWPHILSDFSTHLKKSHVEQNEKRTKAFTLAFILAPLYGRSSLGPQTFLGPASRIPWPQLRHGNSARKEESASAG